jgi:hypothetical protein
MACALRVSAVGCLVILILCAQSQAAFVTFEFTGDITSVSPFVVHAAPGDAFHGRFTYDTATPETGDGRTLEYRYPTIHAPVSFTFTVNGIEYTTVHSSRLTFTEREFEPSLQYNLGIVGEGLQTRDPALLFGGVVSLLLIDAHGIARFGFDDPFRNVLSFSDLAAFEEATFSGLGITGPLAGLTLIQSVPDSPAVPEPTSLASWLLVTIAIGSRVSLARPTRCAA